MKKLLLILLFATSSLCFAQQNESSKSTEPLEKVTASPNPFSTYTRISFYSNTEQKIVLSVKNLLGKTMYQDTFLSKKGNNSVPFYKEDLISGIYLYSLQTKEKIITKRFVIK